ncbi:MAG TPA: glycosyltransferase [Gemmatimonadaceae bacterium]|jgi:glycosyltransferase involved in cell wall biosynthesis
MKRVCIFSLAYYPRVSGAEIAVREITDRIPDIEFHLVTQRFSPQDAREERIGNVVVHRVGNGASYVSKILFVPYAALEAARLHAKQPFDAWWALMSYMVLPVVLMRLGGIARPYILTLQDGDPYEHVFERPFVRPIKPLLVSGFRHASVVQVISQYLGTWPARMGYMGAVEVIPNGVDIARFAGERIPHEGTVLITTSRLVKKNAIDVIIKTFALLPSDVTLDVLGSGVEEAALKALAQECGVAARVRFLGTVDNRELPKYLHAADIFVRPSRSEGMGSSFIEAMAVGLPVVATQVGGIRDFLFDQERNPDRAPTGFAVDVDSPEQVAAAVKEILRNEELVLQVVDNAAALVRARYDWDRIAAHMRERVFGRVLKTD